MFLACRVHDLESLDLAYFEEEVWSTIKAMPANKAPGPDGFTRCFYKSRWAVIKEYIMAAIRTDVLQVKDYRPISLLYNFTKLVTKLRATRLTPFLGHMVSENQSKFICGTCIYENFLLMQQMVCFLHRQHEPRLLLKLDISKAFDWVSWSFLLDTTAKVCYGNTTQITLGTAPI
ncbi:hypothetical protein U9M48_012854 [Paspalum notatum var. saurae]|uniref:Reverse transcriptase domain-containing protein n=1 Tax=Paspalum notatum var. saurae TaxID=547442 RepID=A0AAQ3SYC9_PASNO